MDKNETELEFGKTDAAVNVITGNVNHMRVNANPEPVKLSRNNRHDKDEDDLMKRGDFKFFYSGRKLL